MRHPLFVSSLIEADIARSVRRKPLMQALRYIAHVHGASLICVHRREKTLLAHVSLPGVCGSHSMLTRSPKYWSTVPRDVESFCFRHRKEEECIFGCYEADGCSSRGRQLGVYWRPEWSHTIRRH